MRFLLLNMRDRLIKLLGGYTNKEYTRLQGRYQGLLDSKTNNDTVQIVNNYIYIVLKALDTFAKEMNGLTGNVWASKMYNVIHNNFIRLIARYLHNNSAAIYKIDVTLDQKNQFIDILKEDNREEEQQFILETD